MSKPEQMQLAELAYQQALECELAHGCCPQCVLASIQETMGFVDDGMIKASHGLSGGGGLLGEGVCGALAGGLMALSAKRGRERDEFHKGRFIANFKQGKDLVERFREEFGGITCKELQKKFTGRTYNMWDADEYQAFDEARGNQCAHVTGTVTKWLVEML